MTLPNLINDPDTTDMGPSNLWREVRSNARDSLLDRGQNVSLNVDTTAGGTIVLTVAQREPVQLIRLTGTPGVGYTVEFADGDKQIEIENVSGQSATIETNTGATSPPVILTATTALLQIRGTDISVLGLVSLQVGALLHSGQVNPTGSIDFADFEIQKPVFTDYAFESTSPSSSSGTLTLNMELGGYFDVTLTEDVTTLTISNPPDRSFGVLLEDGSGVLLLEDASILLQEGSDVVGSIVFIAKQDGTGGHDITWPSNIKWETDSGSSPAQTTVGNAIDIYWIFTTDGGTTWFGVVLGLDMK